MKKSMFMIALAALLFVSTSALSERGQSIEIGSYAPEISLSNSHADLRLSQMRGKYVLLTFWSSADAASRINNNKYAAWLDNCNAENLSHIAINLDQEPELFAAIAERDGLDKQAQFNAHGLQAKEIASKYGLDGGYGSILIGPDGRIIGFNPGKEMLAEII